MAVLIYLSADVESIGIMKAPRRAGRNGQHFLFQYEIVYIRMALSIRSIEREERLRIKEAYWHDVIGEVNRGDEFIDTEEEFVDS